MFIGHFAPALVLATHRQAPSLPVLMIGAQLVDWAFFALLLTGTERMRVTPGFTVMNPMDLYHMPHTHSLLGCAAFALAFALLIFWWTRRGVATLIGFAVVLSHWFLDLLVHAPDLSLVGSGPKFGFGLWNHPMIEMPLEMGLTFGALWFYAHRTRGSTGPLIGLALLLLVVQLINWFGPPPAAVDAVLSLTAFLAFALVTLLAWWVARKRALV